jgi:hypothetical protein
MIKILICGEGDHDRAAKRNIVYAKTTMKLTKDGYKSQVGRVRFFCAAKKRNPTFTLVP